MKLFIDQAMWFLGDLNNLVNEIDEIKKVSVLKTDSEKEIKTVYKQFDVIVEWLNKQSKKVWEKIEKLETMLIGIINESVKRTKKEQENLKEELKADITAFWPLLSEVKEMIWLVDRDHKREYEELEWKVSNKLEKTDLDEINKKLKKKYIDDENISEKTAYSSKKTIEKIDSMINNLRLWGRGKLFILNEWSDLWQATAINFTGSAVDVTVVNGVHTVDVTWGWWGSWDVVWPASAIDDNFASFDTTTWKLIQDSGYNATSFAPALWADDNYVTDAQLTVIGNTSWTNTWDQDLSPYQLLSEKWVNNWYAELDWTGKVPTAQLPSYVDDVIMVANFAALPWTGETDKIYVTEDTNLTYRWNWSSYTEISASLALWETSSTAYRWDRGKTAYDHSQLTSGNPHNVTKTDVGLSNVVNADTTTTANITDSSNKRYVTDANLTVIGNTSWTNTGDQTSIVWITGTLAEFNTALTGADFATLAWSEALTNKTILWSLPIAWTSSSPASLSLAEDTDNGTNKVIIQAPATLSADYTLTLPTDDWTANQVLTTDWSWVLSWTGGSFKWCRLKKSWSQSLTGTGLSTVNFDAETFDTDTMHDNATNNTRITFTTAWYYSVTAIINSDVNAVVYGGIRLDWTTYIGKAGIGNSWTSTANGVTITVIYNFSANSYVEVLASFGTAGATACKLWEDGCLFMAHKIG